ncbi:amidohydrolase family protein [Streptosporangium sp. NPDC049376]|uniref:amidohydrolase family protein n=1 Tax=Streptosporangium sp. NPDC049376 TaxID=3366192 RepID=UPI003799658F
MPDAGLYDCDTHFTDHLPEIWEDIGFTAAERPEVVVEAGVTRLRLGDRVFPKPSGPGHGNPKGLGHLIGPGQDEDRAVFTGKHGIAAAVLQPGFVGLSVQAVEDEQTRLRLLDGYNRLASRACARSRLTLKWAFLASAEDPKWSEETLRGYADDPHLVAVVVRPTARTATARLNSPDLAPLLGTAARLRLPLAVHGGTGCHQWSPLADAYDDYAMTHAFGHMGEQMIALADLVTRPDGLPDGLRVVMLESGIAWIPSVLGRLASHTRRLAGDVPDPVETFREHFAVVPDPGEEHVLWAARQLGAESILFGSDYPHWDTVESGGWLAKFSDLCPPDLLAANTSRFVPRLVGRAAGDPR